METDLYADLRWRGLFYQQSNPDALEKLLNSGPQSLYAGFDPTAQSLHIGHLVPLIALRRFQLAGHCPIALVGGATGLIGDPSGRNSERSLNAQEIVEQWSENIKRQLAKIIDFSSGKYQAILANNYSWTNSMTAIEFLRDVGKHFTVNWMIAKDSVRSRLESEDGISYTEFSYMILQAYDFLYLAKNHQCRLQIGGSDQWGNMVAGIELVRKKLGIDVYVATFPLITSACGKKFGKSEGGAIWLDADKTSPYEFYQYWINVDDLDVVKCLKYFTFLSHDQIGELEKETARQPEKRLAQKQLAAEMTKMLHGEIELANVIKTSEALFGKGDFADVDVKTLKSILSSAPMIEIPRNAIPDLLSLAVQSGLSKSKSDARKIVQAGGLYMNNQRIQDIEFTPRPDDFIADALLVLRKGKKNYAIVQLLK